MGPQDGEMVGKPSKEFPTAIIDRLNKGGNKSDMRY